MHVVGECFEGRSYSLVQGWTDPGCHVARATKYLWVSMSPTRSLEFLGGD
jgi:hypothetical protein